MPRARSWPRPQPEDVEGSVRIDAVDPVPVVGVGPSPDAGDRVVPPSTALDSADRAVAPVAPRAVDDDLLPSLAGFRYGGKGGPLVLHAVDLRKRGEDRLANDGAMPDGVLL